MFTNKRITRATVKKFIKENIDNLYILNKTRFDGMVDGLRDCNNQAFCKATPVSPDDHNLGIAGAYFIKGNGMAGDYFRPYNNAVFTGIDVNNCCGHFIIAVKKEATQC